MSSEDPSMANVEQIASGPFAGSKSRVVWGDARRRGSRMRVGIICARFNGDITNALLSGAHEALAECGIAQESVTVVWVPGAFEAPLAARYLAWSGAVDAVVCLGAVIRGETGHYDFVAGEAASGVQRVQLDTGVPVTFGVLTTDSRAQAEARSGGAAGNKGYDATLAAIEMADVLDELGHGADVASGGDGSVQGTTTWQN